MAGKTASASPTASRSKLASKQSSAAVRQKSKASGLYVSAKSLKTAKSSVPKKSPVSIKKTTKRGAGSNSPDHLLLPKLPRSVSLRDRLSLLIPSPNRFPISLDTLAMQSARVAGMAFVFIGAFFTYYHSTVLTSELAMQIDASTQRALLAVTDTSGMQDTPNVESATAITASVTNSDQDPKPSAAVSFIIAPEKKRITVHLEVPYAEQVKFMAVGPDAQTKTLGTAAKIDGTHWRYVWNTDGVNGGQYVIFAKIKNTFGEYTSERKNVAIPVTFDNAMVDSAETESSEAVAAETEDFGIDTGIDKEQNLDATNTEDATDVIVESPEITIEVPDEFEMGIVTLKAMVANATALEWFAEPSLGVTPKFLGRARKLDSEWLFAWDTKNSPNGEYRLYATAKIDGSYYSSEREVVRISHPTLQAIAGATQKQETVMTGVPVATTTKTGLIKTLPPEVSKLSEEVAKVRVEFPLNSDINTENGKENSPAPFLERYKEEINKEMSKLSTALRSNDPEQVRLVENRIARMKETIIKDSYSIADSEEIVEATRALDNEVARLSEHVRKTETIVRDRVGDAISKDTDADGISDFDEQTIYATDPTSADSDNDGFVDGTEILRGYDPLDDSPEAVVAYESPKEKGLVRADLLTVHAIEKKDSEEGVSGALISGVALPNSFITLYVYSTPTIVTVKTEEDGSWQYTFDRELEDGEHEVYVGMTDNTGAIVAKSEPLKFIKTAEAFTQVARATESPAIPSEEVVPSLISDRILLVVLSISVMVVGLILLLLGIYLGSRRREYTPVLATGAL